MAEMLLAALLVDIEQLWLPVDVPLLLLLALLGLGGGVTEPPSE